ncbi:MAG: hypothetical protein ACOYOB_02370 [Myxococcota bacterium]|jgi:hypothetical protein
MSSPTHSTDRIRKAKKTSAGQGRKREQARAQRIQSEKKLEAALGEKVSLPTIR